MTAPKQRRRVVDLVEIERLREKQCGYGGLEPSVLARLMPSRGSRRRANASRRPQLSEYGPGTHWVAQVYAERTGQEDEIRYKRSEK